MTDIKTLNSLVSLILFNSFLKDGEWKTLVIDDPIGCCEWHFTIVNREVVPNMVYAGGMAEDVIMEDGAIEFCINSLGYKNYELKSK